MHGANRLGTNSLVDILVFGQPAGQNAATYAASADWPVLPTDPDGPARAELEGIRHNDGSESIADIRREMRSLMMDNVSVFRTAEMLDEAVGKLRTLKERFSRSSIMDKGQRWNTELLEAWELGCLLDLAEATAVTARRARRAAARTSGRTSRSVTIVTGSSIRWPGWRATV